MSPKNCLAFEETVGLEQAADQLFVPNLKIVEKTLSTNGHSPVLANSVQTEMVHVTGEIRISF